MTQDGPASGAPKRARSKRTAADAGPGVDSAREPEVPLAAVPSVVEDGTSMTADHVEIRLGAVGRVESGEVVVDRGAIGAVRTEHLSMERGAVGAAMANRVELSRGYARSILARQVQLDRAAARVVIAADVRATQTAVMFLVARRVSGEVKVLFDWRGAVAFGAVAGIIFAILSRVRRPR
jgi:hypothetical protein